MKKIIGGKIGGMFALLRIDTQTSVIEYSVDGDVWKTIAGNSILDATNDSKGIVQIGSGINVSDGIISVDKNSIGLNNVDNTSDLDKPISNATKNSLNNKLEANNILGGSNISLSKSGNNITIYSNYNIANESSNGLMSNTDKFKLDGIQNNAEVNVINSIQVNGIPQPISDKTVNILVPDSSIFATKTELNNYLPLSGGTVTGYTSIAGNMAISNSGITTNTGISVNGMIDCQNIVNTKTYFRKTSTTLNKNNTYAQNTHDNDLIFTDSENRTIFRIDSFLGPTNTTGTRLLVQSRDSSVEAELALRWGSDNTPAITWSYPTNGVSNELARCDWVKNQINSIIGQDVITVYSGRTGILNTSDGSDTSHAYICFKKSGNSGVLYGNIKLSREAAVNLKNNCPDLRSGHQVILSVPLYGYYSDDTTISTHFITTTYPVIYDVSANNYKMIDTSTRSFMVGLSLSGGLLLACPRLDTTSISTDDLIFFDFIGLCHV